ncbi:unnamed protein product [Musa hybrid cultivar]
MNELKALQRSRRPPTRRPLLASHIRRLFLALDITYSSPLRSSGYKYPLATPSVSGLETTIPSTTTDKLLAAAKGRIKWLAARPSPSSSSAWWCAQPPPPAPPPAMNHATANASSGAGPSPAPPTSTAARPARLGASRAAMKASMYPAILAS